MNGTTRGKRLSWRNSIRLTGSHWNATVMWNSLLPVGQVVNIAIRLKRVCAWCIVQAALRSQPPNVGRNTRTARLHLSAWKHDCWTSSASCLHVDQHARQREVACADWKQNVVTVCSNNKDQMQRAIKHCPRVPTRVPWKLIQA